MEGKGVLHLDDKSGLVYEGNFENDHYQGQGKLTWMTGEEYIGVPRLQLQLFISIIEKNLSST